MPTRPPPWPPCGRAGRGTPHTRRACPAPRSQGREARPPQPGARSPASPLQSKYVVGQARPPGIPAGDGAVPVLEGELALLQLHDKPRQVLWGPGGTKTQGVSGVAPAGDGALTLAAAQSQASRWRIPERGESGPLRPRTAGVGLTTQPATSQVTLGTSLVPALACKNRVGTSHHSHTEAVNEGEECLPAAAEGVPRACGLPLLLAGPRRADGSSGTTV